MTIKQYRLLQDSKIEPAAKEGHIVFKLAKPDYGLASEDTRLTGIPHVSVTLDPSGDYPSFTVPKSALQPIEGEAP
jgi:hypothetical protein